MISNLFLQMEQSITNNKQLSSMKTMKNIWKLTVVILFCTLGFNYAKAQSHVKNASNCVMYDAYLKETSKTKNAVSCVDCYCKVCGDKKQKEKVAKIKAEEAAAAKQNNTPQKKITTLTTKTKSDEVILVAPKSKIDKAETVVKNNANVAAIKKTPSKPKLYFEYDVRKSPKSNYYYYPNETFERKVVFETNYKSEGGYAIGFKENSDYTIVKISGGNERSTGSCGTDVYDFTEGVINRKGELVYQAKQSTYLMQIGTTPFFLLINQGRYGSGGPDGCSAEIINVKNGKFVAFLSQNSDSEYNSIDIANGTMIFSKNQKNQYTYNRGSYATASPFTDNLNKLFNSGKYEFCMLYGPAFKIYNGATAYLFGSDGSFKMVNDSWVSQYRDQTKE